MNTVFRSASVLVAASMMILTRAPGPFLILLAALLAAGLFATFGILGVIRQEHWLRPSAIVAGMFCIVLPASADALLAVLPPALPAIVFLLACQVLISTRTTVAPDVSLNRRRGLGLFAFVLPTALVLLIITANFWLGLLPGPLQDLTEMRSAAGPIYAVAIIAIPISIYLLLLYTVRQLRSAAPPMEVEQ